MNAFQTCKDTSDIVALYLPQQLYVKPVAKINISLKIPNVVKVGKSISHWEIMEKLRELIKPEEFGNLKVSKSTLEFVRFEADLDNRKQISNVVNKLDNKTVKLKNFTELMRLKAGSFKSDFPNRNVWDGFFHEAKDMSEMKPGERPDTIHFSYLPTKWFVPYHLLDEEDLLPSEKILYKIFEKFGPIRYVDVPICDPYRDKMKDHISGIKNCQWKNKDFFEAYVQFKDYIGFTKCMDFFKDMKLIHKDEDEVLMVDIKVDFDRTKHLSDASIRRREIVRERLVKKQMEKEERDKNELEEKKRKEKEEKQKEADMKLQKEQRRKLREEKRKALVLEKLKINGADEINAKIAKEEKKLLKVQRKLESIRLVEELFRRIKEKKESETGKVNSYNLEGDKELRKFKNSSELEVLNQKNKLHNAIQGRVMLKTALQGERFNNFSSSSSDEESVIPNRKHGNESHPNGSLVSDGMYDQSLWYGYPYHMQSSLYQPPPMRGHHLYNPFPPRGRGFYSKGQYAGTSRGGYYQRRPRGYKSYRGGYNNRVQYPPEIEEEYIKYFSKFLHNQHDDRSRRSRSRSRKSRSRSYSRRRSYSRSVSRSRRSRSRRSSSRSKSRDRRSRSKSRRSRRSRSYSRSRRTESNDRSKRKSTSRRSERSRKTRTPEISRKRSKSWSLPKEKEKRDSWSKSPEKTN